MQAFTSASLNVPQADVVGTFAPLSSFGCMGSVLAWRDQLPAMPAAQPVADVLTRVAVKQAFSFLGLLRTVVCTLCPATLLIIPHQAAQSNGLLRCT